MGISRGHFYVVVAQQLADCVEVNATHHEAACKGVAKVVPVEVFKSSLFPVLLAVSRKVFHALASTPLPTVIPLEVNIPPFRLEHADFLRPACVAPVIRRCGVGVGVRRENCAKSGTSGGNLLSAAY
jgi:hypothetical protein